MGNTFFAKIQSLIGKPELIEQEKALLEEIILNIIATIKSHLTPVKVPGLLFDLALRDFRRLGPQIGQSVTDFAGQARFLRALCASVPFTSVQPAENPHTDELLKLCDTLWPALFQREMLDDLKTPNAEKPARHRYGMAALTSLLSVAQQDLVYLEQVEARLRRNFGPFSNDIIEPAIGLSVDQIIKGFARMRSLLEDRWENNLKLLIPAREMYEEYCRLSDAGASRGDFETHRSSARVEEAGRQMALAFSRMEQLLLFTPQDFELVINERSPIFLNIFSFRPGQENTEVNSPTSEDVVRKQPFARLGSDNYSLMDIAYSSYAPLRRLLDCFDTDRKIQRLNKRRDSALNSSHL